MSYTANPTIIVTDRIRLIIGDTDIDDEDLTDEVYSYVYEKEGNNEFKAAITCLNYIIAATASYVTEKSGGLFSKENEKHIQYRQLRKDLVSDPRTAITAMGIPYAGGIKWSEYHANIDDADNRQAEYRMGIYPSEADASGYNPYSFLKTS